METIRQLIETRLPADSFVRNVITLMTGTTFAQALTICVAPILTRLYNPDDFGIYALYTSIVGVIAVISCLRYELAIVLPERDEDAANLLVLTILICFSIAVFTLFLVATFRNPFVNMLGAPELAHWLWLIPLSLFTTGLFQALNYWSTRRKHFKQLAVRQITQTTVTSVTQLLMGFMYNSAAGGLIGGALVGQIAATGRLVWHIGKAEGTQILKLIKLKELVRMLSRYKEFPYYSSWAILLNTISAMLPAFLLGYFFSPVVVGFYALGSRVLTMPLGVVGTSIGQVFYPKATINHRQGDLASITLLMFNKLVSFGMVPIILLTIVSPQLFAVVFGDKWIDAGVYVRWMGLWTFFQFISAPISTVYMILDKQKQFLLFNIILLFSRIAALVIGGFYQDSMLSIKLFGISGFLLYLFFTISILKMVGINQFKIWLIIGVEVLKSIPYALVPIITIFLSASVFLSLLSAFITGIIFLLIKIYKSMIISDNYFQL